MLGALFDSFIRSCECESAMILSLVVTKLLLVFDERQVVLLAVILVGVVDALLNEKRKRVEIKRKDGGWLVLVVTFLRKWYLPNLPIRTEWKPSSLTLFMMLVNW